jgi:hypothetical protein
MAELHEKKAKKRRGVLSVSRSYSQNGINAKGESMKRPQAPYTQSQLYKGRGPREAIQNGQPSDEDKLVDPPQPIDGTPVSAFEYNPWDSEGRGLLLAPYAGVGLSWIPPENANSLELRGIQLTSPMPMSSPCNESNPLGEYAIPLVEPYGYIGNGLEYSGLASGRPCSGDNHSVTGQAQFTNPGPTGDYPAPATAQHQGYGRNRRQKIPKGLPGAKLVETYPIYSISFVDWPEEYEGS